MASLAPFEGMLKWEPDALSVVLTKSTGLSSRLWFQPFIIPVLPLAYGISVGDSTNKNSLLKMFFLLP